MLVVLGLACGCATVLDLEGYQDAAASLCACPGFEKVEQCAARAHARISAASEAERAVWLARFEAEQCGTLCEHAAACYAAIPGCEGEQPGCECCPWDNAVLKCSDTNTCQTCRTCFELATEAPDMTYECAFGRSLLLDVRECACSVCTDDCTGFCQNLELLTTDPADTCHACLEQNCKVSIDACFADKPQG
ncbi:hypothetical protein [Polyangium spumosum]|uniref:Uncharacterized protein n=1 Tax=Polyangium spumosum TaxID=889282 RepID=A0A6N7PJ60_9BACT|nr:hypothetical protein [Polyangium spumosum]MRG92028.1 hypothetical protein [Polyangium spumosum]